MMAGHRPPSRLPWYARVPAVRWRLKHGPLVPRSKDIFYQGQKRRNTERRAALLADKDQVPGAAIPLKRPQKKNFDIEGLFTSFVMFGMGCMCFALVILLVLDVLAKTDLAPCLRTVFAHP